VAWVMYTTHEPNPQEEPKNTAGVGADLTGFIGLIRLYRLLDTQFFISWNRRSNNVALPSLEHIQNQLASMRIASPGISTVDFQISRNWLQMMVWQLSVTLDFSSPHRSPMEICRELVELCDNPACIQGGMEIHGLDLVCFFLARTILSLTCKSWRRLTDVGVRGKTHQAEKLFDVAINLSNYMPLLPENVQTQAKNYLLRLFNTLTNLSAAQERLGPTLHNRILGHFRSPIVSRPTMATPDMMLTGYGGLDHALHSTHGSDLSLLSTPGDMGYHHHGGNLPAHSSHSVTYPLSASHTPIASHVNRQWGGFHD
jgi:hypothetical protein